MILPDVLTPGLHLVLCGTAPSRTSKEAGAYYARPGNLFWPTLHRVGLTPVLLRPAEYPRVLEWGIGLTDVNKTEWGSDAELSAAGYDPAGLVRKIEVFQPAALALDSKNAARAVLGRRVEYGLQPERIGPTRLYVLPSPSGRARNHWDIRPWEEVGAFVAALRAATAGLPGAKTEFGRNSRFG
ncbi:mismatch-specific DNA-glycosylase [Arenibaculum pallidiluteum]|uniref:mismatch-specific DNA-glycosylase n=1 Tax=Arenibaculum pallidiluteum TaxID=2812559 RepID=UPI001A96C16D|nr:mismatch-specific DNA-glycosylase [Arenibaculum pallidiluteum]